MPPLPSSPRITVWAAAAAAVAAAAAAVVVVVVGIVVVVVVAVTVFDVSDVSDVVVCGVAVVVEIGDCGGGLVLQGDAECTLRILNTIAVCCHWS